jgi:hypothetical protein
MVSDTVRVVTRLVLMLVLILSSAVMLSVALFKVFWLLMGTLALDNGPMPRIYVVNLVQAPAYLVSAATAWKWPWFAESVAGLTLVAIFTRIIPPPIFPYERYLSWEYAFVVAANVAFIAGMSMRRSEIKSH